MRFSDDVCRQARDLIASRLGLALSEARLATLEQGLLSLCHAAAPRSPETALTWLAALPNESPEWTQLASQLTVGETYFFRDQASFAALEQEVLPALIAARRAVGLLQLRLWSAGCATGEEPYSLAILLDRLLPDRTAWHLTILATDIHLQALQLARQGRYRAWSFRAAPTWLLERYCQRREAQTFEVAPRIRQMVTFMPLNLVAESARPMPVQPGMMDVILCRHVLMYFTPEAQRATVGRLQRALVPGGWLVVSAVEASAALLQPLLPVNLPGALFYRKAPTALVPALPGRAPGTLLAAPAAPVAGVHASGTLGPPQSSATPSRTVQPASPLNPATALQRARVLADRGDLEPARDLCKAALVQNRLDPEAHVLLAVISQECGELAEALAALRRAIYLAPHAVSAHLLLGGLLLRQGEWRRGRRSIETALDLLRPVPRHETVPCSGGVTAGRLLDTARAYLESW